uniref:small monomeric GTPase n=1 Tax=Vannella robusta TaxID=1487602 RepID=A0A7S4M7N8_9EUKA
MMKDSTASHPTMGYNGCSVIMLYDITSRESFDWVASYFFDVSLLLSPPNFVLAGNKTDLEHLRVVPREEAEELALFFGCKFVEISCRDKGKGVEDMFSMLIRDTISEISKDKDPSAQKPSRGRCAQM